jgi:S-adenosylmethionine:tRNA ribosyltransferase-isomerase
MRRRDLDYQLPPELIAQTPLTRRDASRLLVYERSTAAIRHRHFSDLSDELAANDLLVLNDTRVIPGRLRLQRASGGLVEVLLVEQREDELWECLARPSRRLRPGEVLSLAAPASPSNQAGRSGPDSTVSKHVELVESLGEGRWLVQVPGGLRGEVPLPPYIHESLGEAERYQTVFAREEGSAAAPTAGLHLTPEILRRLDHAFITLHVGIDTFRPLISETLDDHRMHGELYEIPQQVWAQVEQAGRVVAVGTTSVRALESVARGSGNPRDRLSGRTELMITPGYEFRAVDALVTNFHLPASTLLALVMAFAGVDATRELYQLAIAERYRFYSFGDAMLIL